ncbi:MAG: hypothetical protein ABI543_03565 [Ignavibacteria bacterium]
MKFLTSAVLLFCLVFCAGCSSSNIETIDSGTLKEDHKDISTIYSFKLRSGESFNDSLHNIYLNFSNSANPEIIYNGPDTKTDTSGNLVSKSLFQSFSLFNVLSAKVKYKKSNNPLWTILGGIAAVGIIIYIFWANGERNKK